jgi:uncharacterized protein (DUF885 family)
MKFVKRIITLVFIATVSGCISNKENSSQLLTSIVNEYQDHKGYDEQEFPLGLFTKKFYQFEADFAKTILKKLSEVSEIALSETEVISLKLLKFKLKDQIDYFTYERFLNPLLSDAGFHSNLNYIVRPLSSYKAAKDYLNKLNAIPVFVNQHFVNLREGLEIGVSQPKVIFNGYESTYEDHIIADFSDSYFYKPFKSLPENITQDQKDSILSAAKIAIENSVIPQFKRIKTFFEEEYLPKTRTSIGVSETPGGEEYYQNRINFYTTSTLYSAEDIHQIGLKEVARIKAEMLKIIKKLKFKGNFSAFLKFLRTDKQFYAKTSKELLMFARDIAKRADEQLPRFFKILPRKPYGVAPVPDAISPKYTGGQKTVQTQDIIG